MRNKKKKIGLIALIFCFVSASVAFAAFGGLLQITGTTTLTAGKAFNVGFASTADGNIGTGSVEPVVTSLYQGKEPVGSTVSLENENSAGDGQSFGPFEVTLNKPGDKVEYTVYIKNDGKITANVFGMSGSSPSVDVTLKEREIKLTYSFETADGQNKIGPDDRYVNDGNSGGGSGFNAKINPGEAGIAKVSIEWMKLEENTDLNEELTFTIGPIQYTIKAVQ